MLCVVVFAILAVVSCGHSAITPVKMDSSMLRQALPQCPSSCCKKYCIGTAQQECTAPAAGATAWTCATGPKPTKNCLNTFGTGCAATQCTPKTNCNTACGIVISIADIVTCD